MYTSKINKTIDILWQRPKSTLFNLDKEWYDAAPVGRDPLNNTMKDLSKNAGLSMTYTNHCIRTSVVKNLNDDGFEACDIMATTGHKSECSIRSYATKCPPKKRRQMCDSLAAKMIESDNKKQKKEPASTVTSPQSDDKQCDSSAVRQDTSMNNVELFPDFEDQDLVKVLTQIENENQAMVKCAEATNPKDIPRENGKDTSKTVNNYRPRTKYDGKVLFSQVSVC